LRELEAAQPNLIHTEKMASRGQLTAGIAHEIKSRLNFVSNFAGCWTSCGRRPPAVASLADEMRREIDEIVVTLSGHLEKILEHGGRAGGIFQRMVLHSRGGSGERRNELVVKALDLAYHGTRARDPNFNLTPRALRMTERCRNRGTNDCWPNLGLRGPGVLVAMRDRQVAIPLRPQNRILPLLGAPAIATMAPQSSEI